MQDQATGSLWSQLLGRAMEGELDGQTLQARPSVLTQWKSWKEKHPLTTVMVLPPLSRFYESGCYQGRLGQYLIGVCQPGYPPKAWRFDQLTFEPIVNDFYADEPIVIAFQENTGTATIFHRRLNDQTLEFSSHSAGFTDAQTKSVWDALTGISLSGPLKGQQLTQATSIPSFSKSWDLFHNDSEYWGVSLPLFFSNQTVENVSSKCEEVSKEYLTDLYRLNIRNQKKSANPLKLERKSKEFIGSER